MKVLIEKMIQLKKTINDLLGWLRDPIVARWDVIDEMKKYSNNIPSNLLSPETETLEDQLLAPLEIIFRGPSAVSAYHKAISEGKTIVKRVPIMFIGQGQSGKTSLKGSLKGERFNAEETTTKGIETDPSYCKVSPDVWKIGDGGEEATTSDPGPISYVQRTAECILKSLKEDINVDNPTYSKDSQEFWKNGGVEETDSDHADVTHNSSRETGVTGDEVGTGPDQSELNGLPDEIATALVETWRQQEEADSVQDEDLYSVLWDFGGQSVYYATHPIFLTTRAIYLLVYNLSRDPNGKVSPQVKRGFYEDIEDVFCERSNMDYLDLWMSSVSSLVLADEDFHELPASDLLPERLPPVFLVCTHADKPYKGSNPHRLACKIFGSLKTRVYGDHLVDFFFVDNTKSGSVEKCPEVDRLRREVKTVAKELPQPKEGVPIKWLKFEKEMKVKNQAGHKWISLDEAKNIAAEKCGISINEQFVAMLNFLHDHRIIIHFDDTQQLNRMVILDPQWLIDVFKEVITIRPYQRKERKHEQLWLKLEKEGILKEDLFQHVWGPLFDNGETCDSLIAMMEKFCLLCPLSSSVASDSPTEYLVPSMLKFPPQEDLSELIASAGIPPLYLKFTSSQVPFGLFPRLVLMVFQWCTKEFSSQTQPQLLQNFARFYTHPVEGCSLILQCHSSFIEVVVHKEGCATELSSDVASGMNLCSKSTYDAFQLEFARAVCRQLGLILECIRKEFPWLRNMAYDLSVCCPVCCASRSVDHCRGHNVRGCKEEQCLHLLSESQLCASHGSIVCTRSVVAANCKVPVDFIGLWFRPLKEQQATDSCDERRSLPCSGDAHNDQAVVLCGGVLEALTTQTCDASAVVAQFQKSLSLENLSLEQPDLDTKKKIRYLCLKAKTANKLDVVKKLREITPAGTTGPLLPEQRDVATIPLRLRQELTINLSGGEEWKFFAERLGLTPAEIRFLDKRVLNPCDAALEHARKQGLIENVGDLYDRLVNCEFPRLADLL
ncbi:uncharacterized protein LOC111331938 [Stylophora pistillata]|uniref:uncharacterized protein LOC111331938 n=1 Tax=Stylophora pistillata TaxID=50429 RepID=UPI000C047D6C|nr:uncharacterized protein LOC111331938 [Stylophora pistillata]